MQYSRMYIAVVFLGMLMAVQCKPTKHAVQQEEVGLPPTPPLEAAREEEPSSWSSWFNSVIGEENLQKLQTVKDSVANKAGELVQSGREFIGEENIQAAKDARDKLLTKAGEMIQSARNQIGEERIQAASEKTGEIANQVSEAFGEVVEKIKETFASED